MLSRVHMEAYRQKASDVRTLSHLFSDGKHVCVKRSWGWYRRALLTPVPYMEMCFRRQFNDIVMEKVLRSLALININTQSLHPLRKPLILRKTMEKLSHWIDCPFFVTWDNGQKSLFKTTQSVILQMSVEVTKAVFSANAKALVIFSDSIIKLAIFHNFGDYGKSW